MLSVRAERADIAWAIVHQSMPYHLVFPLEALATLAAWAGLDGAVVRSVLAMHVPVRAANTSACLRYVF